MLPVCFSLSKLQGCLLANKVLDEKSTIILILVPRSVMYIFSSSGYLQTLSLIFSNLNMIALGLFFILLFLFGAL